MTEIEQLETIVFDALSEYVKKHELVLSSIEYPAFSDHSKGSQGLKITLDNGKVLNLIISDEES